MTGPPPCYTSFSVSNTQAVKFLRKARSAILGGSQVSPPLRLSLTQAETGGGQNDASLSSAAGKTGEVAPSVGSRPPLPRYAPSSSSTSSEEVFEAENYQHRSASHLVWLTVNTIVLILYRDDDEVCDETIRDKWRRWLVVYTIFPAVYLAASMVSASCLPTK